MSVTFFIPIMLAHAWASHVRVRARVCARAHRNCMHAHTRHLLHEEVGAEGGV